MEDNYDPNIPKWANANYPITSLYDAQMNVLEEALPFQSDHMNKKIRGNNNNRECKCYDYVDLVKLVQTFSKMCVFYRIKGCVIIKCPQIENEVRDEFVRHLGQ
jgi:hypothetical protein